jgi:hypothetical protein
MQTIGTVSHSIAFASQYSSVSHIAHMFGRVLILDWGHNTVDVHS